MNYGTIDEKHAFTILHIRIICNRAMSSEHGWMSEAVPLFKTSKPVRCRPKANLEVHGYSTALTLSH